MNEKAQEQQTIINLVLWNLIKDAGGKLHVSKELLKRIESQPIGSFVWKPVGDGSVELHSVSNDVAEAMTEARNNLKQ